MQKQILVNRNLLACVVFAVGLCPALQPSDSVASDPSGTPQNGTPYRVINAQPGYLFIDCAYVAPPYDISLVDGSITINSTNYDASDFGVSESDSRVDNAALGRRRGRGYDSRHAGERRGRSPLHRIYRELESLQIGAVVVMETGSAPMILWPDPDGENFLTAASMPSATRSVEMQVPISIASRNQGKLYRQFLANFEATPSFKNRLAEDRRRAEVADGELQRELTLKRLTEITIYPLTMLALMLVVFAVGHLMANAQTIFTPDGSDRLEIDPQLVKRNISRSLLIVAGLSFIDLVWTLIAHQSGAMRELNPIGNQLIGNPFLLVLFKTAVTGMSIGLLYWLRTQPLARKATWWCCLVLTLLTARWLTFHSLLA